MNPDSTFDFKFYGQANPEPNPNLNPRSRSELHLVTPGLLFKVSDLVVLRVACGTGAGATDDDDQS